MRQVFFFSLILVDEWEIAKTHFFLSPYQYDDFNVCDLGQILMLWDFGVVIGTHAWHMNYSLISVGSCPLVLDVLGSKIFKERYGKLCQETLDGISAGIRWYNVMSTCGPTLVRFLKHDILISLFCNFWSGNALFIASYLMTSDH